MVEHPRVSKCYGNDCLQNFILIFVYFLKAPIAKNSYI